MNLIVVPTYNRPEFLRLCLERILSATGSADKDLWIVEDEHWPKRDELLRREISEVVLWIKERRNVRHIERSPHNNFNNSFSILEAYKDAYHAGYEHVYMIEDDIMVMDDFFEWHSRIQEKESVFVSCAERHNNSLNVVDRIDDTSHDPQAYVFSKNAYSSLGVCFPRASLELITQKLATREFYTLLNQDRQMQQDVAIQNLMWSVGGQSVWPVVPRCFHEGWYGTGCTIAPPPIGTLSERTDYIRKVVSGDMQIKCDPKWGHNIVPVKSWTIQ